MNFTKEKSSSLLWSNVSVVRFNTRALGVHPSVFVDVDDVVIITKRITPVTRSIQHNRGKTSQKMKTGGGERFEETKRVIRPSRRGLLLSQKTQREKLKGERGRRGFTLVEGPGMAEEKHTRKRF